MKVEVLLENVSENRSRWLELKKNKVSSSNIAVIAGLSKWKSPLELWSEWTGKTEDTFAGNVHTELGTLLEPFAAKLYAKRTGRSIAPANALYANDDFPWAVVSPDFLMFRESSTMEGVLEVKTGTSRQLKRWSDGNCPEEYVAQLQFQLGIMGLSWGTLTAFLGLDVDQELDFDFEFDSELFSMLVEEATSFIEKVKSDIPPNAGPGDAQLIQRIAKRRENTKVFTRSEAELADGLIAGLKLISAERAPLKDQIEELEEEKKQIENSLKLMLGDSSDGLLPDGSIISVKTVHVKERLAKAYSFERLNLPK